MHEEDDAEVLRRRLYRPGASTADLDSYLDATAADDHPAAVAEVDGAPSPAPRWTFVLAALGVATVLAGGALAAGASAPLDATPTSSAVAASSPVPGSGSGGVTVVSAVLDTGRERQATGDAVAQGPDRYRYTVAQGDAAARIAHRFGLCTADVLSALPYGSDPAHLPAGQDLLLQHLSTAPRYDGPGAC